jgi:hypothetical protein
MEGVRKARDFRVDVDDSTCRTGGTNTYQVDFIVVGLHEEEREEWMD